LVGTRETESTGDMNEKLPERSPGFYRMEFGKYKGKTLNEIAESDEGLKYLDWLVGERPDLFDLKLFLGQPTIKRELEALLDDE